jgi:multidrug efflux pump subunit AcrA (membrane-fusion protein)
VSEVLTLTGNVATVATVHVIDGADFGLPVPADGILIAHALSPLQRQGPLGGRVFGFSADARLSLTQLAPLREAAMAHAGDNAELPDTAVATALLALRDALMRALPVDGGLSFTITAASRRFGVCLHLAGDDEQASLNAAGLGLGVWSLRCQQSVHVRVLGADARAAHDLDYCRGSGEDGLPAISTVCGERAISGISAWLALTVRGAALADPMVAGAHRVMFGALLRALSTEVVPGWNARRTRLFRAEALAARNDDIKLLPLQLLLAPAWTRRGVQALAASLVLLVVALFIPVRDRLGTSALLSLDGAVTVSALSSGRVLSVSVVPGQHVAAGTTLVQLNDSAAAADAERAYADYVALLRRRLAHVDAAEADPALAQAWERLQQARSAAQPSLRAPGAGRVLDLSVVSGQPLAAGAPLVLFAPDDSAQQLDLDLPARAASRLKPGTGGSVRFASLRNREFPIRIVWVARTLAASSSAATPHVHARAAFVGKQTPALPGTRADVRIDLGTEPLFRLLFQRWVDG